MKFLIQAVHSTKPHYKHFLLLCLLFFSLPTSTTQATSVKQEPHKTQKTNINNDLDDQKEPGETSIEGIDTERNNTTLQNLDDKKDPDEPIGIKQEKKQDKPSFDFKKLKDLISTAIEEVEKSETKLKNNEMVYFYGNTGSGKSTIINYLLGNELEKYYPEDEKKHNTNKKHVGDYMNTNIQSDSDSDDFTYAMESNEEEEKIFSIRLKDQNAIGPSIGQNAVQSETTYPCPYFPKDNDDQLGYCDTAGFGDSRGIENIVCSYIGNNLIIQKSNKLKAICFLTYKSALETRRGQPFLDTFIVTIDNLVKKTKECNPLDSIFIVLNNKRKIDNAQLVEEVFNMLKDFRKGFKEKKKTDLQNTTKYEKYINILKKILQDSSNKETMRILAINPLDDGTSRKNFLHRISTSPIIPKQNLKKLASKQGEETIRYLQEEMLRKTNPVVDKILKIQNTINEQTKKVSKLDNQIQNLNKEKENTHKENEQMKIEKENERIKIEKEQEELREKIIQTKQQREEIEKQIDQLGTKKTSSNDNKETDPHLSKLDNMIKSKTEQVSKLEDEQNNINTQIHKLQKSLNLAKNEIDRLTPEIENETKQIQQFNKEKNILIQSANQERIIELAQDNKNWFDYYQKFLTPISKYWADTKHEPNIFDDLKQNIYNALKACNRTFVSLEKHASSILSVDFNRSGTLMASASEDHTIKIWDTSTWNCIKTLKGHNNIVHSVRFNPSGTLLASSASGVWDNRDSLKIWDTRTWKCVQTLKNINLSPLSLSFHPSKPLLVSGFSACSYRPFKTVKAWQAENWHNTQALNKDLSDINSVHFHRSGTLMASGASDHTVKIWNTRTWKCIKTLKGHLNSVHSVHFHPSHNLLASGSWDHTVKIWETNTWNCIKTLAGHSGCVTSVHFNPSGTLIASGSGDHTVKIWETRTWNCIKTLKGHSHWVTSVRFNPSGTLLTSGSADYTVKIWDVQAVLNSNKTHYRPLNKGEFKRQTDNHIKKIKEIIAHYYDAKIKKRTESPLQKKEKILKDHIKSLTKDFFTQKENELTLQKKIHAANNKIDTLEEERIEKQIKKENKIKKILIQKSKTLDSTIENLEQSQRQKKQDLHNISLQLLQAQGKHDGVLHSLDIIQDNHQEGSYDRETQEKALKKCQGILQKEQPGIDLILKIDSIVPMGLIAYSFIQKYMQCKANNKHIEPGIPKN